MPTGATRPSGCPRWPPCPAARRTSSPARSGLPRDWPEGTSMILEGCALGRHRTIGLGRADDRYFTFCAGFGLDAAVIRRVEQARRRGRVSTPGALPALDDRASTSSARTAGTRRSALERPGEPAEGELATVDHPEHRALDVPRRPARSIPNPDGVVRPRAGRAGAASAPRRQHDTHGDPVPLPEAGSARPSGAAAARRGGVHAGLAAGRRRSSWTATTSASGRKCRFTSVPAALRVIC